ncbi:MAG: rod shape-determining protein [Acidobacteriia bacterium]|nr:rod shape-determining protein [Terriglobia bacterium]MYC66341.1 rod shape-determining protein [Terriglobia bacterium]
MRLRSLLSLFSHDLAIDLGTANTLIYIADSGVVVDEPSMVGVNNSTGEVEAIGIEAKRMLGRTPGTITAVRPMRDGVIADFKIAERMLTYFINKAHNRNLFVHPRIVIGVPGSITHVERRAVIDSAMRARASEVHLVEQAMMAAIGAGLPVSEPAGSMVVDIGGGTTDVAVISMSGVVYSKSVSVAGNAFDDAIIQYLRRKHNFLIGERTAERVKVELGAAKPLETPATMEIKGRNLTRGVPAAREVTDSEIHGAIAECVEKIMFCVREALEHAPPEISSDICDRGIVLTGGGAYLKNLDQRIRDEVGVPVSVAENPLHSVVVGTGMVLEDFDLLSRVSIQ